MMQKELDKYRESLDNVGQKLDNLMNMIAKKFQVSIPAELVSKEYSNSLKKELEGDVLDDYLNREFLEEKTIESEPLEYADKQKEKYADELALDQTIPIEGPSIYVDIGVRVLPQISDLQKTEEQSEFEQNSDSLDMPVMNPVMNQVRDESGYEENFHVSDEVYA